MEVLTIEHSAFQQLISKIEAMDEFIRKAKLEQQSSLDDDWVDGQAVCEYLCICDKTLQRLRSAGKITYSTIGNKYYYQIAEIKRCLRAHTIKSSEEMLQNLFETLFQRGFLVFGPLRPNPKIGYFCSFCIYFAKLGKFLLSLHK